MVLGTGSGVMGEWVPGKRYEEEGAVRCMGLGYGFS